MRYGVLFNAWCLVEPSSIQADVGKKLRKSLMFCSQVTEKFIICSIYVKIITHKICFLAQTQEAKMIKISIKI